MTTPAGQGCWGLWLGRTTSSFAVMGFPSLPLRNHGCAVKTQTWGRNEFAVQRAMGSHPRVDGLIVRWSAEVLTNSETRFHSGVAPPQAIIPDFRRNEASHNPTFSPLSGCCTRSTRHPRTRTRSQSASWEVRPARSKRGQRAAWACLSRQQAAISAECDLVCCTPLSVATLAARPASLTAQPHQQPAAPVNLMKLGIGIGRGRSSVELVALVLAAWKHTATAHPSNLGLCACLEPQLICASSASPTSWNPSLNAREQQT
ncbi:hypothetical protein HDV57DRAFT_494869 [Trichoderma longibrachiatum]|uniref:Uncharacterized protein n=1 Tax=Trichoderma longibrachiatum ATCC 18648 TaxID=983965 RepID=A0A2T4C5H6_TRILO|nr:hypothetical protein M440DRAFT_303474 [Trichoderma longibrachiatum ATCC 18648]